MKLWHYLTGLAALIFCGTSLVFTVGLWISIPGGAGGQLVAGLTATALELCKFSFAPLGLWLRAQGRAVGYALLVLWPLLVLISIGATVGFLASHAEQQQQLNARSSLEYRTLQQQLGSVEQQITTLNNVIATDAANGYRQRAIETAAQLQQLEQQRSQTLAKLQTLSESSSGSASDSAGATFATLAGLTHIDPKQIQHSGFLALAIITDVVGLVALMAFNSVLTATPTVQREQRPQPRTVKRTERTTPLVETAQQRETESPPNGELTNEQQQLAERIIAREFGERPVLRNINREVRGGNQVVKPVFDHLQKTGVLIRDGRGFALA
ncbi:hypothetical protein [uncultured Microbulbifer sp.]|uniref:hypothetical protein n=1 Tax=uncultured Microbulbifer sp. TaxID=348147 RepID=UPI00261BBF24|nr:hypothetical protein [uncultured Microbulbifer sp.]